MPPTDIPQTEIETLIGQSIQDASLYRQALTHRSLLRSPTDAPFQSNERLEFLGDALIDLIVSEVLYERFPEKNEGDLTRIRAKLVSGAALAQYARRMNLGPHILMSDNAAQTEGRDNPNILADAFEALAGALYLDQDYAAATQFVHEHALDPFDLEDIASRDDNYKSQLLEHMQAVGEAQPTYRVVDEEGPSHDKTFTVEAVIDDTAFGRGTASSKQDAEQEAARRTLEELQSTSQ